MAASGNDLETAMALFFDGGGAPAAAVESDGGAALNFPDWWSVVWPERQALPDAWIDQSLDFGGDGSPVPFGLNQPKNGPCGVLAGLHALVAAQSFEEEGFGPGFVVSDAILAKALAAALLNARPEAQSEVTLAAWSNPEDRRSDPSAVALPCCAAEELEAKILSGMGVPGQASCIVYRNILIEG